MQKAGYNVETTVQHIQTFSGTLQKEFDTLFTECTTFIDNASTDSYSKKFS